LDDPSAGIGAVSGTGAPVDAAESNITASSTAKFLRTLSSNPPLNEEDASKIFLNSCCDDIFFISFVPSKYSDTTLST
jgi:hypothetical protein